MALPEEQPAILDYAKAIGVLFVAFLAVLGWTLIPSGKPLFFAWGVVAVLGSSLTTRWIFHSISDDDVSDAEIRGLLRKQSRVAVSITALLLVPFVALLVWW